MNEASRVEWGQVEKIGKGTKASYDPQNKVLTFCFNRSPDTSGEALRQLREALMVQLRERGYSSRMKYNGEVIVDNVEEGDVVLERRNHKLLIRLNSKQPQESPIKSQEPEPKGQGIIKFS